MSTHDKVWRALRDVPNTEGFGCLVQQTNAAGNLEEVQCTVRKDATGCHVLVENRTCYVVRMDRAKGWRHSATTL